MEGIKRSGIKQRPCHFGGLGVTERSQDGSCDPKRRRISSNKNRKKQNRLQVDEKADIVPVLTIPLHSFASQPLFLARSSPKPGQLVWSNKKDESLPRR